MDNLSNIIAIFALLVSIVAGFYSHKSFKEAKKSNDIGKLNTLWAFKNFYDQERSEYKRLACEAKNDSGRKPFEAKFDYYSEKLNPINEKIDHIYDNLFK